VTSLSAYAAMLCIVLMVCHILLEIVLRNVFSTSTFLLEEFVGYATASATFFGLAAALRDGELIRVGILLEIVGPSFRRLIEARSALLALATCSFIGWFLMRTALRSFERGTTSTSLLETPLWISQLLIFVGVTAFWLQISVHLIKALSGRLNVPAGNLENQDT